MGCLTEQAIAEYVEGQLDEPGVDRVESHIDGCTDCRMAVAEAARWNAVTKSQPGSASDLPPASSWPSLSPSSINGEVAPGSLLPRLEAGAQVGRYVVRRVVGAGGMGIVYAAYDAKLDREIALKLLRPELNRFAEERLDREARLMARLAHPNVITIHDVGTLAGQAYVAMELVVGETLGQKLRSTPRRSWQEVLDLFLAAGRGLAAAHREGVVHRDFKPDNVPPARNRPISIRSEAGCWQLPTVGLSLGVREVDRRCS